MLDSRGRKEQKDEAASGKGELPHLTQPKGGRILHEKRPHSHPNQHTEAELKLIRDMRRRNPQFGLVVLWRCLKQRGCTRRPENLFRVMRRPWQPS